MKFNWNYIKITILSFLIMVLYSFAGYRSAKKEVKDLKVQFIGNQDLYVTNETVNKLLIQNYGRVKNIAKEKLDLNNIEKVIAANAMVKSSQVYLTVNGQLTSKIEQRRPIARIESLERFYLDDEGKRMPLSKNHSARVPIITGNITGKSLEDIYEILKYINKDDFLRKNVIGIHIKENNKYQLKFRMDDFIVNLGGVEDLEKKFNNFRAFYTKATKDKTLDSYNSVSLEYDNQVVCTKI